MADKKKTRCVLCGNLCGLEVQVEDNQIVKVRSDKDHPRSQGYICRKGTAVAHYQHHADRLLYPMKKVGDAFERISWDQALDEIAEKLKAILDAHGPRSLALMGGGTLGSTMQFGYVAAFMNGCCSASTISFGRVDSPPLLPTRGCCLSGFATKAEPKRRHHGQSHSTS